MPKWSISLTPRNGSGFQQSFLASFGPDFFFWDAVHVRTNAELREFMSNPAVAEIITDAAVARVYAEIIVSLRRKGTPLPVNDVWIAACAATAGAPVLTYDSHFQSIERAGSIVLG